MTTATYLDAAATSPMRPAALAAMQRELQAGPGNASSVHSAGHRAREAIDQAREQVAAAFAVRPSEVIFTSGGTEANNLAIIGLALADPRGKHLVTTPLEHPSVTESCAFLQRVHGFEVTEVGVDRDGRVSADRVAAALRDDTTLVSIGLANGEIGTVQPLPQIAQVTSERGLRLHTDAVQAAATLPVSMGEQGWPGHHVQAMTIASHKFGGPQGAGALIVRNGLAVEPLIHGGGQEFGLRSGTENIVAISGFAAAVVEAVQSIGSRAAALVQSRDQLIRRVLHEVPGAALTGHVDERLPGHASFVIEGVSGESLLVALDAAGFMASSGSACAAGRDEPSPVLLAVGITPTLAQTALRFTLHEPLSDAVLDRVVRVMVAEVARAHKVRQA